jgi:DNA polymerase-1
MYRTITNVGEVRQYLSGTRAVAFDFETSPDPQWRGDPKAALDPHRANIVGVSFSVAPGDAVYVPVRHILYRRNSDETGTSTVLRDLMADTSVIKIAHNLAYEAAFLYALGIVIQPPVYDTIAAAIAAGARRSAHMWMGTRSTSTQPPDASIPT